MKLNYLSTEFVTFSTCLDTEELEKLKSILSLNSSVNPVHVVLHNRNESGQLTYVAFFCNSVFYIIRYPNAHKEICRDSTGHASVLKNNTLDIFCFSYSSVTGMTIMNPNPKQFINPCLFIKTTGSENLQFAVGDKPEVLYLILNLYHIYSDNKK